MGENLFLDDLKTLQVISKPEVLYTTETTCLLFCWTSIMIDFIFMDQSSSQPHYILRSVVCEH